MNLISELIRERVREACAWYDLSLRERRNSDLRSLELKPAQTLTETQHRQQLVDELCNKRATLVRNNRLNQPHHGSFLIYYPDMTLSDGTAQFESGGFFDADNEPPWDLWIFFATDLSVSDPQNYGALLVSWIPDVLRDHVDRGIKVNPEQCLEWANESNHPLVSQFR